MIIEAYRGVVGIGVTAGSVEFGSGGWVVGWVDGWIDGWVDGWVWLADEVVIYCGGVCSVGVCGCGVVIGI